MKRALRIFIRIVTLPLAVTAMIVGTLIIGLWVLLDWLFETEDNFYPVSRFFKETMNDFKKYWKGFFR